MFRKIFTSDDYAGRASKVSGWFFQRVTGLILAVTLIAHLIMVHIKLGSGPMPVSVDALLDRFSNPVMHVFYLVFLYCAAWHGANGLVNILDDYVHKPLLRWCAVAAIWAIALFMVIKGTLSIVIA